MKIAKGIHRFTILLLGSDQKFIVDRRLIILTLHEY